MNYVLRSFASIVLLFAAVSTSSAQTGSNKTATQLNSEVNGLWPDNTTGAITPFNARQTLLDIIASTSPGVVISGTPSAGYVPVATGATDASWQPNFTYATNGSIFIDQLTMTVPTGHSLYSQQITLNGAAGTFGGFFNYGAVNIAGFQAFLGFSNSAAIATGCGGSGCQETAGGYFIGKNDNVTLVPLPSAYGVYTEGRAVNNGFTTGIESDCQTISATAARVPDPNNIFGLTTAPLCYGVWVYLGGTQVPFGANDSSAAMGINGITAGSAWKKGIVFSSNAIRAIGGHSEAIDLYQGHEIAWYSSGGVNINRISGDGSILTFTGAGVFSGSLSIGTHVANVDLTITGSGASSGTSALFIQNSSAVALANLQNNGAFFLYNVQTGTPATSSCFDSSNQLIKSATVCPGALSPLTFSTLPAATAGTMAYITDGLAGNCGDGTCSTFGTTVTGGSGALKLLVWRNGSNWALIGK